ncbi:MAG: iron-containing alcohol dehydrogenase [Verrucomicrobia bacterium]|nr:iron-containing alcohol dehydrogenase [Verrucomicrobiota bacterium]
MALANAGLGAVHGFAGPIGGMFPAPHGAVCAALLPHATRINLRALQQRHPGHPSIDRYAQAYAFLSGNRPATPELLPEWLVNLVTQLHIPGLATHGVKEEHFPVLIQNARQASSMKANPVPLTDAELGEILKISL